MSGSMKFVIVYCLVFAVLLFGFNYVVANDHISLPLYPYCLSENCVTMEFGVQGRYDPSFLLKERNAVIIAETDDRSLIGLFDPTLKYYFSATKYIAPGVFRYFSFGDYEKKERVGISIREVSLKKDPTEAEYSELERKYNLKVIHAFDHSSGISCDNHHIEMVVNLFALDGREIKRLYIDSEYPQEIDEIVGKFESQGFVRLETGVHHSIWTSLGVVPKLKKYVSFFTYGMYIAVFLLIYLCFVYTAHLRRNIVVSLICGATVFGIAKKIVLPLFVYSVFSSIFTGCSVVIYMHVLGKYKMNLYHFLEVLSFVTTVLAISLLTGTLVQFSKGAVSDVN